MEDYSSLSFEQIRSQLNRAITLDEEEIDAIERLSQYVDVAKFKYGGEALHKEGKGDPAKLWIGPVGLPVADAEEYSILHWLGLKPDPAEHGYVGGNEKALEEYYLLEKRVEELVASDYFQGYPDVTGHSYAVDLQRLHKSCIVHVRERASLIDAFRNKLVDLIVSTYSKSESRVALGLEFINYLSIRCGIVWNLEQRGDDYLLQRTVTGREIMLWWPPRRRVHQDAMYIENGVAGDPPVTITNTEELDIKQLELEHPVLLLVPQIAPRPELLGQMILGNQWQEGAGSALEIGTRLIDWIDKVFRSELKKQASMLAKIDSASNRYNQFLPLYLSVGLSMYKQNFRSAIDIADFQFIVLDGFDSGRPADPMAYISYLLTAMAVALTIAALLASGGLAGVGIATLAAATDLVTIAVDFQQLQNVLRASQLGEAEEMLAQLEPSIEKVQVDQKSSFELAMFVFSCLMIVPGTGEVVSGFRKLGVLRDTSNVTKKFAKGIDPDVSMRATKERSIEEKGLKADAGTGAPTGVSAEEKSLQLPDTPISVPAGDMQIAGKSTDLDRRNLELGSKSNVNSSRTRTDDATLSDEITADGVKITKNEPVTSISPENRGLRPESKTSPVAEYPDINEMNKRFEDQLPPPPQYPVLYKGPVSVSSIAKIPKILRDLDLRILDPKNPATLQIAEGLSWADSQILGDAQRYGYASNFKLVAIRGSAFWRFIGRMGKYGETVVRDQVLKAAGLKYLGDQVYVNLGIKSRSGRPVFRIIDTLCIATENSLWFKKGDLVAIEAKAHLVSPGSKPPITMRGKRQIWADQILYNQHSTDANGKTIQVTTYFTGKNWAAIEEVFHEEIMDLRGQMINDGITGSIPTMEIQIPVKHMGDRMPFDVQSRAIQPDEVYTTVLDSTTNEWAGLAFSNGAQF